MFKLPFIVLKVSDPEDKFLEPVSSNTLDKSKNTFLDRFGKIIVAFYQVRVGDSYLLVLPKENRMQELDMHVKLSKATVEKTDFKVYFDPEHQVKEGEYRVEELVLSEEEYENTISQQECNLTRLEKNIPLPGIDFEDEMVLNVSDEWVSFTKGCYPGQEVVARTHNLAKPGKKLVVIDAQDLPEEKRSKMTSVIGSKGFVFVLNQ